MNYQARLTDPPTSVAAAKTLDIAPACQRVLDAIRLLELHTHGATAAEITRLLPNGQQNVVVRRCRDLEVKGLVTRRPYTRPGPSGRQQIVWSAK